MAGTNNQVAEMQGLYGPFTMAERVVQKIWLRGDFDRHRAVLTDGRPLGIRASGAWNLLGGPDFRNARLVLDGRELTGDIEVHFHATDWRAHGHEADSAYGNVALHVVLFHPADGEEPARRADGRVLPTLVLLPLLHRDLEEYASDDALEVITARDEWEHLAELAALPEAERRTLLLGCARERWRQKVHFARRRIERVGWTAAAHQTALEILGYRLNRAAMLTVATIHPLEAWRGEIQLREIYAHGSPAWELHGVRPANHPWVRLQQYQRWTAACPDWPDRVGQLMAAGHVALPPETPTKPARQLLGLRQIRETLAGTLMGHAVGGTRLDNLLADGLLPLLAVATGRDYHDLWFHWFLGDIPDHVRRALTKLGVVDGRAQPLCHGYAQGLLGWLLAREAAQVAVD